MQPFVLATSEGGGAVSNISNVSWEQLDFGLLNGRIPLSAWTGHVTDTNTFVYLDERTGDSGTRRTLTQGTDYNFNDTVGIYLFDVTNNLWYTPSPNVIGSSVGMSNCAAGSAPFQVIGSKGRATAVQTCFGALVYWRWRHQEFAEPCESPQPGDCLPVMSDCKGVGASNWGTVVSYDGFWPTAAGYGLRGNTGTNDYSPITSGYYPIWGFEVIDYPSGGSGATTYSDPGPDL